MTIPTQKSLNELLDEIETRANAATPGPWIATTNHQVIAQEERQPPAHVCSLKAALKSKGSEQRNGIFIAAARSDVPRLVKALRFACETIEDMSDVFCGLNDMTGRDALYNIAKLLSESTDSSGAYFHISRKKNERTSGRVSDPDQPLNSLPERTE